MSYKTVIQNRRKCDIANHNMYSVMCEVIKYFLLHSQTYK